MMDKPLVSVHMLTYNHRHYIRRAIEGVLIQETDFKFELVIGEDCSTDETMKIIQELKGSNPEIIRIVTSEHNVGIKQNFYRTFEACSGRYVAFCEGDDYWHNPQKLQKQVNYLEENQSCAMLFSDFDVYIESSGTRIRDIIRTRHLQIPKNFRISDFLRKNGIKAIVPCTVMFRRDVASRLITADQYLYLDDVFPFYDTQLWAEISTVAEIGNLPESLATYRILDESISNSRDRSKQIRFLLSAIEMKLYLCDKYKLSNSIKEEHKTHWLNYSLELSFLEKNRTLADEVRKNKKNFTMKEWFRYFGSKYESINFLYRQMSYLVNRGSRKKVLYWDAKS